MGAVLVLMAVVPMANPAWHKPLAFALLGLIGIVGGMVLIPCEGFVQVRARADRKGSVIASVNFAVFAGILLSGPAANVVSGYLRPTAAIAGIAAVLVPVGLVLWALMPKDPAE